MAKASLNLTRVCFLFLALFALTNSVYALPFTVVPRAGTSLPTSVIQGASVTAYYTVSNNTTSQRNNNFVKYLPPNTVQVTNGGPFPDTCGAQFNLAPVGKPGNNCTLQLKVSGPVNGNDPDPHHHLFVCFPGGKTCAGTNFPLNVVSQQKTMTNLAIQPLAVTLAIGLTQQFTATATFNDGSSQNVTASATWTSANPAIASISASGLATALLFGGTNITATFNAFTSSPATLTVTGAILQSINVTPTNNTIIAGQTQQYTAIGQFSDGTTQNITTSATWNTSNPTIASIAPGGLATGLATGTTNISASQNSVTSNNAVLNVTAIAYVLDGLGGRVIKCTINPDGRFGPCGVAQTGFGGPFNMTLTPNGSLLYVVNNNQGVNSFINFCPVNLDGNLGVCTNAISNLDSSTGVTFNAARTKAYIAVAGSDTVLVCNVQPNGAFSNCMPTGSGFADPLTITLNAAGTIAYVVNEDLNTVSRCPINSNDGTFVSCGDAMDPASPFLFDGPHTVTFNSTELRAYITNFEGNNVSLCNVTNTGRFTGCINLPNNFADGTADLAFSRNFTQAYIVSFFTNTVTVCNINSNTGAFTTCVNAGGNGFIRPAAIVLP